jgi:lipopolysaccharide/colanic/teichoic acid biosynthesis glycosyltransferase
MIFACYSPSKGTTMIQKREKFFYNDCKQKITNMKNSRYCGNCGSSTEELQIGVRKMQSFSTLDIARACNRIPCDRETEFDLGEFSFRRIFDFYVALFMLVFTFPAWLIIGILIKLDSPGPVFYSQERVGKKGRIFKILKFRTMHTNAEKHTGPVLSKKNDSRITRIGKLLRLTRIDEIPQFFNVLIGDMSFIGPRPERPFFVEQYSRKFPLYSKRLELKPGITGLAQVSNGYDNSINDVKLKLDYDLKYLQLRNSLLLNLRILVLTFITVFTGKGQ